MTLGLEIDDITSTPCRTFERIDDTLRTWIGFVGTNKGWCHRHRICNMWADLSRVLPHSRAGCLTLRLRPLVL